MNHANFIELIRKGSVHYIENHLKQVVEKRDLIRSDAFASLNFFLSKIYNQGRKDEVSAKVRKGIQDKIIKRKESGVDIFSNEGVQQIIQDFEADRYGRARDIKMTAAALQFISQLPDQNIVKHSIMKIKGKRLRDHFEELDALPSVGHKIASFYLRDLVTVFGLESFLRSEDYYFLQPIDTWVNQIAVRLGIICKQDSPQDKVQKIVAFCEVHGVSPIEFNHGLWYIGKHSLDIVLESVLR